MFRLWAITLFDLVQSLVSEHTQKETFMSRSKFIRLSGWSLMLGALTLFLFFLGITVDEQVYDPFRRFQAFTEFSYLMFIWATPVSTRNWDVRSADTLWRPGWQPRKKTFS
jgi:hypothetical protein